MLGRVMVNRFFRPAVVTRIALLIGLEPGYAQAYRSGNRLFIDCAVHGARPKRPGRPRP